MTQYYVVNITVSRPSSDVPTFWDYNRSAAQSLENKLQTFRVKNELLSVSNGGKDMVWQVCFTDELQYQNLINECKFGSASLEINLRKEYDASVGIVRTVELIGYVNIPE